MDIGKHCHECRHLDFLPFTCNKCGELFCGEHRLEHTCVRAPQAPTSVKTATSPAKDSDTASKTAPSDSYKLGAQVLEARRQRQAAQQRAEAQRRAKSAQAAESLEKGRSTLQWLRTKLQAPQTRGDETKLRLDLRRNAVGDEKVRAQSRVYYRFTGPPQQFTDPITNTVTHKSGKTIDMYFDRSWSAGRALDSAIPKLGLRQARCMLYNNQEVDLTQSLATFPQYSMFVVAN